MRTLLAFLVIALTAAASAAESVPHFNAVLTMNGQHRFVLTNASGESSRWLELNEAFDGHVIKAFDVKANTLDLEKGGVVRKVALVNAAIGGMAPSTTPATLADAEDMLHSMRFDDMMKKIMDQQKQGMLPMIQQAAARSGIPAEHRERFMELQSKILDETFAAMAGPEMRNAVATIYSEVFTKEELAAVSAFHTTPAGQAMIDKQPAVQQRMMEVMMRHMAQVGPRMQQMQRDFQAEVTAAKSSPPPSPPPESSK